MSRKIQMDTDDFEQPDHRKHNLIATKSSNQMWLYISGAVLVIFLIIFLPILFAVILKDDNKRTNPQVIIDKLQKRIDDLKNRYTAGTIGYSDFKDAPESYVNHVVELKATDFAEGTVKLVHKALYRLKEDVVFNPNPTADWKPICATGATFQAEYCSATTNAPLVEYKDGFFAAITMQGRDIILDMNEKTVQASEAFAIRQRKYANIAMVDQNMLMTGGTETANTDGSMTGSALISCENCAVYNGTIGRSSQFGIQGINNSYIVLKDLIIKDYEMAAVAAAGLQYGAVINATTTAIESIPLNYRYNQGKLLVENVNSWINSLDNTGDAYTNISAKLTILATELTAVETDIAASTDGFLAVATLKSTYGQISHGSGSDITYPVDHNQYGFVFGCIDNFYGGFQQSLECTNGNSKDVVVQHSTLAKVAAKVSEENSLGIVTTTDGVTTKQPFMDVSGFVVSIPSLVDSSNSNSYIPNTIYDLLFTVAYYADGTVANADKDTDLVALKDGGQLGPLNIPYILADWALQVGTETTSTDFETVKSAESYDYICNIDYMNRQMKGAVGVLGQAVEGLYLDNVEIQDITNLGLSSQSTCGAQIEYPIDHIGYSGNYAIGVALTASKLVEVNRLNLTKTLSATGPSYGAQFWNITGLQFTESSVSGVVATKQSAAQQPNGIIKATAFEMQRDVTVKKFEKVTIE